MLINAMHPEEARVAIVEDGRLVELDIEIEGSEQTRGNVYKGVVVRVEPGLQAAFVDIGLKKLGFLQMGELHPDFWQWRDDVPVENRNRRPRIQEVLRRGQELIVQVEKGERDMKGAALTSYLSFPGRYMVLMPGSDSAGVSRKVESESERKKLKEMAAELTIPEGIGHIMRTEALGKTKTDLKKDLQALVKLHKDLLAKAKKAKAPALIYQESNLVIRTIRDYFTAEIDEVLVDNAEVYTQAREFFKGNMPKYENIVKLHQEKRPIFSRYQLEEQIDQIYEKKVPLKSGGSLVIEPTEALVSIDVNSGKSTGEKGVEDTAFKTNMEAAEEAARQLRLRDLGGLIVIDFIDMRDKKHMSEVEKTLKNALKADKARVTVGRISQFGMLEMSRQRIKQTLEQASYLECPHCGGRGKVKSVENMALSFLRKVHASAAKGTGAEVRGELPLEVAYFLLNRKKRELAQIENDYDIEVTIKGKPSFLMNQLELQVIKREKVTAEEGHGDSVVPRPADKAPLPSEPATEPDETGGGEEGKGKKKRRRRKKGRGEGGETPAGEQLPMETPSEELPLVAEVPAEPAPGEEGQTDEVKKKRRRRRRRGKGHAAEGVTGETAAVEEPAEALPADAGEEPVTEGAGEEHGDEQKKKKRRRRRRGGKRTEEQAAEETPSGGEPAEAPAPVESLAVPAEPVELTGKKPAKPRAPRKKKEPVVVPAESAEIPAVEKVAAPPKPRSRAKKAVAAEEAPAAVVEPSAEPVAKPKVKRGPRKKKEEPAGE